MLLLLRPALLLAYVTALPSIANGTHFTH